jgi:hypothetical protein
VRPIDGYSDDTESQDDENDDWCVFHDQGSQLWRGARQVKFVLGKGGPSSRPEFTFYPMTVARSDRDVSSPDHTHETQHAVNGTGASRYATALLRLSATKDANPSYALGG